MDPQKISNLLMLDLLAPFFEHGQPQIVKDLGGGQVVVEVQAPLIAVDPEYRDAVLKSLKAITQVDSVGHA